MGSTPITGTVLPTDSKKPGEIEMSVWTVICYGYHIHHFGNVYNSYGTLERTAFEIPADSKTQAERICRDAGLKVVYSFE